MKKSMLCSMSKQPSHLSQVSLAVKMWEGLGDLGRVVGGLKVNENPYGFYLFSWLGRLGRLKKGSVGKSHFLRQISFTVKAKKSAYHGRVKPFRLPNPPITSCNVKGLAK